MKTRKTNKLCLFLSMVAFSIILLAKPMAAQAALAAPANIKQADNPGSMNYQTQVYLTWDAVSGATGYDVKYSTDKQNWLTSNVSTSGNIAIISNLTAGTTYYVQVATKDSTGEAGTFSQIAECNTAPALETANIPKIKSVAAKSVTIQWAAVPGATGYCVDFGATSDFSKSQTYTETASTSVTMNIGANAGGYVFITPYRTSANSSYKSEYSYAYTYCATTPSAPKSLQMYSVSSNKKTLTFAFLPSSTVANTDGYQVEVYSYKNKKLSTINVANRNAVTASATKSTFANTPVKYRVRAYVELDGKKYYGSWSGYQYYVPSAKCGSKLKVKSSTSATLSWKKVTGATSYTIYHKTSANGKWKAIKKNVKGTSALVKYSRYLSNYYYVQANSVSFKGKKGKVSGTNPSKIKYIHYVDYYR